MIRLLPDYRIRIEQEGDVRMRLDNTDNAWLTYSKNDRRELLELTDAYMDFLSKCKTERECASEMVSMARKAGYKDLYDIVEKGKHLSRTD